jgi:hypothetical protein
VLRELASLVHSDLTHYFSPQGNLLTMAELKALPREIRGALASVKIVKRNLAAGDGKVDEVIEIKLWPKVPAVELALRHLGLFEEGVTDAPRVPLFALPDGSWGPSVHPVVIETKALPSVQDDAVDARGGPGVSPPPSPPSADAIDPG